MALPTKPNKELNPVQRNYDDNIAGGYSSSGIDQAEAFANDPANSTAQSLGDAEAQAGKKNKEPEDIREQEDKGSWSDKTGSTSNPNLNQPKLQKVLKFAKKRGGVLGLIGIFGVGGGLLVSFLAPSSLLINMIENISQSNDSSSTAMERRFMKVFGYSTTTDPVCASPSSRTIKCKMGRISNSALVKLEKKGMKANFDADTTNTGKKTGYPSKNPVSYTFNVDGVEVTKNASEVRQYLVDTPKVANKVVGRAGAFNMRVQAWSGEHISKSFFKKYGLERNGGLADGQHEGGKTNKERLAATYEKLKTKIPGGDKLGNVSEKLNTKIGNQMGKAKKGGVGYTVAVAGCIAIKSPAYVAGTVAAVQVAQILPVFDQVVASPGTKFKASGYGLPENVTSEDADAIGSLLTEKTVPEGGGKAASALDSPLLQSAMGINSNKAPLSQNYTPGLGVLLAANSKPIRDAQKATEPACNTVMSPAAMWTAFAVDSSVTVAASTTIIGGLIKVGASIAITEVASFAIQQLVKNFGDDAIKAIASNDKIANAQGKDLGDVLGIGGSAFFSAGGMARGLPTLKEGQLSDFVAMQQENENFQKEIDIATLSPFDTSSRYTFLGNIAYNTQMAVMNSGAYGNLTSTLSAVARMPLSILSPSTSAASNYKANACSYAEDFGLNLGDNDGNNLASAEQPAISASGLPCVGLTNTQGNMETTEAIDLLTNEGWLNDSITVRENATIDDMVKSGVIVADTPLADYISTCMDASSGDYIYNAASCTVGTSTKNTAGYTAGNTCTTDSSGAPICYSQEAEDNGGIGGEGVKNPRSLEAMSVFLLDFQIQQSMNGEDEERNSDKPATSGTGAVSLPVDPGYGLSDGWIPRSCAGCASFHVAQDFFGGDSVVKSATDGTVVDADKSGSDNNVVRIQAPNGVITEYWHMEGANILVNAGDTVTAGQQIGVMGCVGICYGTHLHFMVDVSNATDEQVKAITTRPKDGKTYAKPEEWFALYGIAM